MISTRLNDIVSNPIRVELKQFIDFNAYRIAYDVVEAPTFLASYQGELVISERWKTIKYHALREHAGLMFQSKLAG